MTHLISTLTRNSATCVAGFTLLLTVVTNLLLLNILVGKKQAQYT